MRLSVFISILSIIVLFPSCASRKHANISYLPDSTLISKKEPKLNVFVPKKDQNGKKLPVLIFVHGGNWDSGNKSTYNYIGRNFSKKGVITVIPNYSLSPKVDIKAMTAQVAEAIQWTIDHIENYGGNPEEVFLTGHSAGGHLVALAAMDPRYGLEPTMISGIILNDAAGLDMYGYLKKNPPTEKNHYINTWSKNPEKWKETSPITYIDQNTPPMLIYVGEKTYRSIKRSNNRFIDELKAYQPDLNKKEVNKNHISMITQYIGSWSDRYDEIIDFINVYR